MRCILFSLVKLNGNTLGAFLCCASAIAIVLGSGPAPALVRVGIIVGLAGLLMASKLRESLPFFEVALALLIWCSVASLHCNLLDLRFAESPGMILIIPFSFYVGSVAYRLRYGARIIDTSVLLIFILTVVLLVVQLIVGWDREDSTLFHVQRGATVWNRATGFFYNHYATGLFMSATSLYLALCAKRNSHSFRMILFLIVGFLGVLFSGSRMCMAALMGGILIWAFPRSRQGLLCSLGLFLIMLWGCMAYLHFMRPGLIERTATLYDSRWPMWAVQRDIISQYPLFGVGGSTGLRVTSDIVFSNSPQYGPPEFPDGLPESHNGFIGYAVYFGIPAMILWICWLGVLVWSFVRSRSISMDDSLLGCGLLIVMIIASMGSMLPQEIGATPLLYMLAGVCWGRIQVYRVAAIDKIPQTTL